MYLIKFQDYRLHCRSNTVVGGSVKDIRGYTKFYFKQSQMEVDSPNSPCCKHNRGRCDLVQKSPHCRMHTARESIFFFRSKFTSYVNRQYKQQIKSQVQYACLLYSIYLDLFNFTMTRKVYFNAPKLTFQSNPACDQRYYYMDPCFYITLS